MNQTVRELSVVLAVGAEAGCVSVKDVTHHVERGNPIVHEGPKLEGVVYDANVASGEGTVDVQLTPATCVSESRTPVTTTEVTTTRISRAGSVALFLGGAGLGALGVNRVRSEEHTSELQSRENLVCRLLLEKKK